MADPESREPERVRRMFAGIAARYDLLNRLLSARRDVAWRRAAAAELRPAPGERILDLCGGTGDLSVEVARAAPAGLVVCCDFCVPMLARAVPKFVARGTAATCVVGAGDALRLPFRDAAFDAATVGFGVRNFADLDAGLREIRRVLGPGGRLVVLEFSRPTARPLAAAYRVYLERVLPALGDRISGRSGPYAYLARTIGQFPDAPSLAGRIRDAGFAAVGWRTLTGGIVALHTAWAGAPTRPRP